MRTAPATALTAPRLALRIAVIDHAGQPPQHHTHATVAVHGITCNQYPRSG